MTNSNALVEKLTLAYLEKTCDISSMAVEEYVKKFIDLSVKISKAFSSVSKQRCPCILRLIVFSDIPVICANLR